MTFRFSFLFFYFKILYSIFNPEPNYTSKGSSIVTTSDVLVLCASIVSVAPHFQIQFTLERRIYIQLKSYKVSVKRTGIVSVVLTASPFTFPGVHLGIARITRMASLSNIERSLIKTFISEILPSLFTIN